MYYIVLHAQRERESEAHTHIYICIFHRSNEQQGYLILMYRSTLLSFTMFTLNLIKKRCSKCDTQSGLFLKKREFIVILMGCGNGAHFLCLNSKQPPKSFGLSLSFLFFRLDFCCCILFQTLSNPNECG